MFTREVFALAILASVLWSGISADCVYKGHNYSVGLIKTDNPCDHCFCPESGHVACAIVDCFYPMIASHCEDGSLPVREPGKCCPTCPVAATDIPK